MVKNLGGIAVVHGKAGSGKTKYALDYCKKVLDDKEKVAYINLDGGKDKIQGRIDYFLTIIDDVKSLDDIPRLVGFTNGLVVIDYFQMLEKFNKNLENVYNTLKDMAKRQNWSIILVCKEDDNGSIPKFMVKEENVDLVEV